jgi:hypothetical protein
VSDLYRDWSADQLANGLTFTAENMMDGKPLTALMLRRSAERLKEMDAAMAWLNKRLSHGCYGAGRCEECDGPRDANHG